MNLLTSGEIATFLVGMIFGIALCLGAAAVADWMTAGRQRKKRGLEVNVPPSPWPRVHDHRSVVEINKRILGR
jgi:hypothetical protein